MKLRLFDTRIAVTPVEEGYVGSIMIPNVATKARSLGRVIAVADPTCRSGKVVESIVRTGDVVMFQTQAFMMAAQQRNIDVNKFLVIQQNDAVAKLTSTTVTKDSFQPLGNWVLVKPFYNKQAESRIIVPETATKAPSDMRFTVVSQGEWVKEIKVGDEVLLEHGRANMIQIENEDFMYVDQLNITGVIDPD